MRITFLNQKGGVGKSTLCIAVGAALHAAGHRVAFDDRDPQASVAFWSREVGDVPLVQDAPDADYILTDTPGALSEESENETSALHDVLRGTDRFVVVTENTLFSIHASSPMVLLLTRLRSPTSRTYLLVNKVRRQAGEWAAQAVADRLGVTLLTPSIPQRACFERLQTQGLEALDEKALASVLRVTLKLIQ